ncbi:AAA domain-containing protein [archaeon]|nr:AAA domain-containing protein [archaeon]
MEDMKYIANQLSPEGIDEVQRLFLTYTNNEHLAMSGPPGVGRTELVEQFGKVVQGNFFGNWKDPGLPALYDITCDEFMTESGLVGFPGLKSNGGTKTVWENGVATKAAAAGGIFYADEVDQLPGTVQKRLNSLFDDRRRITRRDGTVISAKEGFFGVLSYNPTNRLDKRELEDSVADRFVHVEFKYLSAALEAALAWNYQSELPFEERAISYDDSEKRLAFFKKVNDSWTSFFSGENAELPSGALKYQTFLPAVAGSGSAPIAAASAVPGPVSPLLPLDGTERARFALNLAEFIGVTKKFSLSGTSNIPDAVVAYLSDFGKMSQVDLHLPSQRIQRAAAKEYDSLIGMGMSSGKASIHSTRICIDQICFGQYGSKNLGSGDGATRRDAVTSIAEHLNLIPARQQRTNFNQTP